MMGDRRGVVLLEVLIALVILALVGLASIERLDAALRGQAEIMERERTVSTAGRVLTALTLLQRKDLDQRIGTSLVGEFVAIISRPEAGLYRIGIAVARVPSQELLATVVYRP